MLEKVVFTQNEYNNVLYTLERVFGKNLKPRTLFKYAIRAFVEIKRQERLGMRKSTAIKNQGREVDYYV